MVTKELYPVLEINEENIRHNARVILRHCEEKGISVTGVIKFSDGDERIARAFYEGGCRQLASSRIPHLRDIKKSLGDAETMMLRLPMPSEAAEVVAWCDISLNSQQITLERLNQTAGEQAKKHGILLMLDVGDLREGVCEPEELRRLALLVERDLHHLRLVGIGSTFTCFGSIVPDRENLGVLLSAAAEIESSIGRNLDIISGGSSSSLQLMQNEGIPEGVNHLRIGAAIMNPRGSRLTRGVIIPDAREDTAVLRAEIIEVEAKLSRPYGRSSVNWIGKSVEFEDKGRRKRAIAALGSQDIGDHTRLIPRDRGVQVLGGSSDHTVLDIQDSPREWQTGDIISFDLFYAPLLYSFSTRHVHIRYV